MSLISSDMACSSIKIIPIIIVTLIGHRYGRHAVALRSRRPTTSCTPSKPPVKKPTKTETRPLATGHLAVGARLDGVMMMTDAVVFIDGVAQEIHFPETLELTAGEHTIVAVYMYQNRELRKSQSVTIVPYSDKTLFFEFSTKD